MALCSQPFLSPSLWFEIPDVPFIIPRLSEMFFYIHFKFSKKYLHVLIVHYMSELSAPKQCSSNLLTLALMSAVVFWPIIFACMSSASALSHAHLSVHNLCFCPCSLDSLLLLLFQPVVTLSLDVTSVWPVDPTG